MNELPSSSEPGAARDSRSNPSPHQSGVQSGTQSDAANAHAASPRKQRGTHAAIGVLALLLAAQWWVSHSQITGLREEVAQRLKSSDTLNTETKVLLKSMQDGMKELQGKVSVLENKQTEAQSQQVALEQMYQDLAKNRDDWALAEIEQVLSTASQQLQLAGNVQGALIALQNADNRLSLSDRPQFITVRRAIAKDLDKLRSLPTVDQTGIALRLDGVIGQIDDMPLLADEKPVVHAAAPGSAGRAQQATTAANQAEGKGPGWFSGIRDIWDSWASDMWAEISQLVRVRNVETPDALLLSPTQAYYARENLKLRLLNARLALLSRNEAAFRSDLAAAQDTIAKYFDTRAHQTRTAQAQLRQLQASNLTIEMPTLAESLNAVRNYKAKPSS